MCKWDCRSRKLLRVASLDSIARSPERDVSRDSCHLRDWTAGGTRTTGKRALLRACVRNRRGRRRFGIAWRRRRKHAGLRYGPAARRARGWCDRADGGGQGGGQARLTRDVRVFAPHVVAAFPRYVPPASAARRCGARGPTARAARVCTRVVMPVALRAVVHLRFRKYDPQASGSANRPPWHPPISFSRSPVASGGAPTLDRGFGLSIRGG